MKHRHHLTLLALFVTGPLATAQDPIEIKQSIPVGKKITQSTEMAQNMSMAVAGQDMETEMTMKMTHSMATSAHEGDQKKAILVYESASMKMDLGITAMEFDSESDDPANPFKGMVGKEVIIIFSADDEVVSVEGLEELVGDGDPAAGQVIGQMFNPDQLKNLMNQGMLQGVPKEPVSVGDSWPFTMEMPLPQNMGAMTVSGEYKFKEMADLDGVECAVLGVEGKITGDLKVEGAGAPQMEMTFENATYTGTVYFDNDLGMPRKNDLNIKLTMKMSAGGQAFEAHTDQNIVNTVTKVEDL